MDDKKQSQLRRAENEVVFKRYNQTLLRQASKIIPPENQKDFLIGFVCECSNKHCHERIELAITDFETVRANNKRFIIKPHHEQGDIEHIIDRRDNFSIVEKYEAPPTTVAH
jgi:hypothetical protein